MPSASGFGPNGVGGRLLSGMRKMPKPPQFRCHVCGQENRAWAKAERHAHEMGHARIEGIFRTVDSNEEESSDE